jgi:hypothetical protein
MITKPNWTVLVYMVADTGDSFYQDAMADITEMMEAQFDERVRVVVHADAPAPWQTKCWEVTGAPHVAGRGRAKAEMGVAKEIPWYDKNLLDFVQNAVGSYESDYYLLVLWGHGEGIDWKQKVLADRRPSSIKGAGKRFAPGSQGAIEVGELGKALAELKLGIEKKNVVVGFDACLMGMVEVFEEIHEYVGSVVAAADEIPDTGWPYTTILQWLGAHPETLPQALADKIVDLCAEAYSDPDQYPESKVSFAACDLSKSPMILRAMTDLTRELSACIKKPSIRKVVREARDFAEDLREKAYVDLFSFCSKLIQLTDQKVEFAQLRGAANSVINAVGSPQPLGFVTEFKFSDSYPQEYSKDARAVSICFPQSDELLGSIANLQVNWGSYTELTFCQTTYWPDFLMKFWGRRPVGVGRVKAARKLERLTDAKTPVGTLLLAHIDLAKGPDYVVPLGEIDAAKSLTQSGPSEDNARAATNKS